MSKTVSRFGQNTDAYPDTVKVLWDSNTLNFEWMTYFPESCDIFNVPVIKHERTKDDRRNVEMPKVYNTYAVITRKEVIARKFQKEVTISLTDSKKVIGRKSVTVK